VAPAEEHTYFVCRLVGETLMFERARFDRADVSLVVRLVSPIDHATFQLAMIMTAIVHSSHLRLPKAS
jgi:hypothetical protein